MRYKMSIIDVKTPFNNSSYRKFKNIYETLKKFKVKSEEELGFKSQYYNSVIDDTIYDILPFIQILKIDEGLLSKNDFSKYEFKNVDLLQSYDDKTLNEKILITLAVSESNSFDGLLVIHNINHKSTPYNTYFSISAGEIFYDIYLKPDEGNLDFIEYDVNLYLGGNEYIKGYVNKEKNIIEFQQFTKENPWIVIAQDLSISCKSFHSNMKLKCYFKSIWLSRFLREFLANQFFIATRILGSGKICFSHAYNGAVILNENELFLK